MPEYILTVNGQMVTINVPANMPLLWVLRDRLNLTGTKYSCGRGSCGTCTVLIDGEAIKSCITPVSAIGERAITTIEGLAEDGLHPIQTAWIEEAVSQCGYCQPGQIMTAAALLAKNPAPSDDEINTAMSNVLCRCGTYPRIRDAIKRLVAEGSAS